MTSLPIRLAFSPVLWRLFLVISVIKELNKWHWLRFLQAQKGTGVRVAALIFFSPGILFQAFLTATIVTVFLDLLVRMAVRPLMVRWYNPTKMDDDFGTPLSFRLASRETILAELPSRIIEGRLSRPGSLVRTDRRIWFVPFDWSSELWSVEPKEAEKVTTRPAKSRFGAVLRGLPDRLVFSDRSGHETEFLVAQPSLVEQWCPSSTPANPGKND